MPQPLGKNKTGAYLSAWRDAKDRPECAIAMTGVMIEWRDLEEQLIGLFSVALGSHSVDEKGNWSATEDSVARATLSAVENLHTRLSMVSAAWEALRLPRDLKTEFLELSAKLRKAAGWRNAVAHSQWWLTAPYPKDVVKADEALRYSAKDFEDMTARIRAIKLEVVTFSGKCVRHLHANPARVAKRLVIEIPLRRSKSPGPPPTRRGKNPE